MRQNSRIEIKKQESVFVNEIKSKRVYVNSKEKEGWVQMKKFNVLNHMLVPEHKPATEEEIKTLLERYNITLHQLPKIKVNDPALKSMERMYGAVKEGDVIKIIRMSPISGVSVVYRLVIN